ncbi:MAG: alpha/beta fold hydrolase [Halopseudomonas sp.]
MQLHAKCYGSDSNPPLVILHGLFGSLDNWAGQSSVLAEHYQVWTLDLRNHGRSGWDSDTSYSAMSNDLLQFIDNKGFETIKLLGHSMGGKVAMQFALDHPQRIDKLIVVDIAPVKYPAHHTDVFTGLNSVDLSRLDSRRDADTHLQQHIGEMSIRQFLLKNLYRDADVFAWRMNLAALESGYDQIAAAPEPQTGNSHYPGPTLFIKGEQSDYIQAQYREAIAALFPSAEARVMNGVGHWPHAEKPKAFNALVTRFLEK